MSAAYSYTLIQSVSKWTGLLALAALCCCPFAPTSGYYRDYREEEQTSSRSNYGNWWSGDSENSTDVTELCRGMIDTNSSKPINSSTSNSTNEDSHSKFIFFTLCFSW